MIQKHAFPGVYRTGNKLFTKSLPSAKGRRVYGEKLVYQSQEEYRSWNCYRSKLAAAISKGCKSFPFNEKSSVLYLGAASGTTVSHLSDILIKGVLYAVEISPTIFLDLLKVSKTRPNIIPLLADANKPNTYKPVVENCDGLYQDVSQRNQVEIFIKNSDTYLKARGYGVLIVKARSIDVTTSPSVVYDRTRLQLEERGFEVMESVDLRPFYKDHLALFVKSM